MTGALQSTQPWTSVSLILLSDFFSATVVDAHSKTYDMYLLTGKDPEVICSSSEYKELKWVAGEFYWMESVQSYNEGGWDYMTELHNFVQGGMTGTAFIDAVSGIVNRGCHNPVSIEYCY